MTHDGTVGHATNPTMMSSVEIEGQQWQPVTGYPGVSSKALWRRGGSVAALIAYRPHARTAGLPHPDAVQHLWVVSGQALIDGRWLRAGSYVHVPVGAAHPITASGGGCVLLQVHVPTWVSFS